MTKELSDIDLLIIGGGIHGMYLFHLFKQQKRADLRIKIADPHPAPMHNWKHCTENTGMKFLRSAGVHHIDIDPMALLRFSEQHPVSSSNAFIPPTNRPSLELFNTHSSQLISGYNMDEYWIQTQINDIEILEDGAHIYSNDGDFRAKHVLLAIGNGGQLTTPIWAEKLKAQSFPIHHIYSPEYSHSFYSEGLHTVIVGNGMGAVQAFIKIAESHSGKITLITNSDIKISQYDIEPGWMGSKYLKAFHKTKSLKKRRSMISSARKRGTITPDIHLQLKRILSLDHTSHIVGSVKSVDLFGSDNAIIELENGNLVFTDQILLGTGFKPVIHSELIQKLTSKPELRCSECGYPIVNSMLQWHPHICVSGELAELELGPAAKNIIGARHAGERLRRLEI